jgi:hypothetical protein
MITISSQEVIPNGKSLVMYKTMLMPGKKCLIPVCNFEKAITFERILKKAVAWKRYNFIIEKVIESWDKVYYKLLLNTEFLITGASKDDLNEIVISLMKKLEIKNYSVIAL